MNKDILKYAFNNLRKRLMRSGLTILSILIGVMAIFTLISFGQGVSKYTDDIFEEMGTDNMIIMPKGFGPPGSSGVSFTKDEVDFVSKISGVDVATGISMISTDIMVEGERPTSKYVMGIEVKGKEGEITKNMLTVEVEKGRYLKSDDKNKVLLGYNYMQDNEIFERGLRLGDTIQVKGKEVEIVGFLESIGNPADDANVYMNIDFYDEFFVQDEYGMIYAKAKSGEKLDDVADEIADKLRKRRDVKEGQEDFYVQTFQDMRKTYGNVLGVINTIVILIALISIFVAAINIANTMYTTVLERTQEIGVMKAIGAKNSDILQIFLIEAGMQGTIGGIIGMMLGYGISRLGGVIATISGYGMLQPYFPLWLWIFCIIFSTATGAIAGFLPALQASKLKPVDALRYE